MPLIAMRALLTICSFAVAATFAVGMAPRSASSEVIDLRDGARTTFFGGEDAAGQGDAYGWAMAFGDVDGDGWTDFLCSSANAEGPNDAHASHEQDVYLFFGRDRTEFDSLYAVDAPGVADIVFYHGGFSMACSDIDGDGYDDVILSEIYRIPASYVIFGAPRQELRSVYDFEEGHYDYTPPDLVVVGSSMLGGSILTNLVSHSLVSGDVNDDGYSDIVIGNYQGADGLAGRTGGATYIIFGRPRDRMPRVIDVDYGSELPHPDVVIYGESSEEYPFTLAIGDLDGDGTDDLVASTMRGLGEEHNAPGEIHGFWGKREWKSVYDTQIESFDFAFHGASGFSIGYRLATGDLDGDGRDELILGAATHHPDALPDERRNMGEYRILFGRPRGMWPKWSDAIEMTDVFILGAETGEALNLNGPRHWGIAFSLATGNRDGDGFDDLLIGAGHGRRPDGSVTGRAYLLRGRPRGAWPPFIDLRDGYDTILYGVNSGGSPGYQFDLFGYTTGMADIDGTGLDELFIAAQFADGPDNSSSDAGEVYVIYDADTAAVVPVAEAPPPRAALLANYPNPFNPATTLRFRAPRGALVSLTIYDALGREVARPVVRERMLDEEKEIRWEARDGGGRPLPSGVYFVKLRAGVEVHARKVLLVR